MTTATTPQKRGPWPWIAGVAALAVIVAVLAFLFLNQKAIPLISASPTPTPEPTLNAALLNNRMTVLVIGLDSDAKRRAKGKGVNSDTIMVASVNADQSQVTLMSLPRDTVDLPMPDGTTWTRKVNAIYSERGRDALLGTMKELLQVDINYYVQIDMGDLADMVDAVGGVQVRLKKPLVDAHVHINLSAGRHRLDGKTAEAYVRSRYTTNDFERAGRQQQVLLQLVKKLVAPSSNVDIMALLDSLHSFKTDLPVGNMTTLVELARRAQDAKVTAQVLDPDDGFISFAGDRGDGRGYVLEPDLAAIRKFAAEHLAD